MFGVHIPLLSQVAVVVLEVKRILLHIYVTLSPGKNVAERFDWAAPLAGGSGGEAHAAMI